MDENLGKVLPPVTEPVITPHGQFHAKRPVHGPETHLHAGIDLRGSIGNVVSSLADGIVTFRGFQGKSPPRNQSADAPTAVAADKANVDVGAGGLMVFIRHTVRTESRYMHLSDLLVDEGEHVTAGQPIGLVGDSGDAKGAPHLHFEMKVDGEKVDPTPYVFSGENLV